MWLNAYLVRHVFAVTFAGQMHSMHGHWMALGRLGDFSWFHPAWWPYWFGGMPMELTYAPLVPWLGGKLGLYAVLAGICVIAPAAFYVLLWQLTGQAGWSLAAALAYSLLSPTQAVLPDGAFDWIHVLNARRIYLNLSWDEGPHQLGLALACLGMAAMMRGWRAIASLLFAVAAAASAFGITAAAAMGLCFAMARGGDAWKEVAKTGALAYLLICPLYPPSLLGVLRRNAEMDPDSVWSGLSWAGLGFTAAGLCLLWMAARKRVGFAGQFGLYLGWLWLAIPVLHVRWGMHFVQQAGRYKSELELAIALGAGILAAWMLGFTPALFRAGLVLLAVAAVHQQTIRHKRFTRNILQQTAAESTVEYSVAHWIAENRPEENVYAGGSVGQWLNAFSDTRQFTGGSFPTAPNLTQQKTHWGVYGETDIEKVKLWMKAYGVGLMVVPGRTSAEFWKPFAKPEAYEGKMELMWGERDTAIYSVGRARREFAHSVKEQALPGSDLAGVAEYVRAVEDAASPELRMHWASRERATIAGKWREGEAISLQMNWHSGWQARQGGQKLSVGSDGLGQVALRPSGSGEIELEYTGDWEWQGSRILSLAACLWWLWMITKFFAESIQTPLALRKTLH